MEYGITMPCWWLYGQIIPIMVELLLVPGTSNLCQVTCISNPTLREKTANSTVYHHLSHLSVDIQLSKQVEFREDSSIQMQLTWVIFHLLDGRSLDSTVLIQLTQVTPSPVNGKYSQVSSTQKLCFSQELL